MSVLSRFPLLCSALLGVAGMSLAMVAVAMAVRGQENVVFVLPSSSGPLARTFAKAVHTGQRTVHYIRIRVVDDLADGTPARDFQVTEMDPGSVADLSLFLEPNRTYTIQIATEFGMSVETLTFERSADGAFISNVDLANLSLIVPTYRNFKLLAGHQ